MYRLLFAALTLATAPAVLADVPFAADVDRPFHAYTWLTAHNAFANSPLLFPNQTLTIQRQLQSGVRGLMLDLHESAGRVRLCHGICSGLEPTFADTLNDTILPFIRNGEHRIVTLHLEDPISRSALAAELALAPEAARWSFNPGSWQTPDWPTVREMAEAEQRLIIFTQQHGSAGAISTPAGPVHVLFDKDFTSENYWSLGGSIFEHDMSCRSRWERLSLSTGITSGALQWSRLFVMNHFHSVPLGDHSWNDNQYDVIRSRIDHQCLPAAGRKPNYVAVDFIEAAQVGSVIAALNEGTIEFFDQQGGYGERLCAVAAGARRTVNLDEQELDRCPPLRIRSAAVRDVPAGTRITLADGVSRDAPRVVITIREDLYGRRALISDFGATQDSNVFRAEAASNGLTNGVTHVSFEPPAH